MPYGKYPYRRRRYNRRRYNRRYKSNNSNYKMIKRVAQQQINKNLETKWILTPQPGGAVPAASPVIGAFNSPPQGTTVNERTGNDIRVKSLQIKGHFELGAANTNLVRFIVFQWLSKSPSSPVITDILTPSISSMYVNSLYSKVWGSSFRVLYDRRWQITDDNNEIQPFSVKITKFPFRDIEFNPGTTVGYNQLYYIYMSDEDLNSPSIQFQARMNYTDA